MAVSPLRTKYNLRWGVLMTIVPGGADVYGYPYSYDYGSGLASATLAATPLPTSGNYVRPL